MPRPEPALAELGTALWNTLRIFRPLRLWVQRRLAWLHHRLCFRTAGGRALLDLLALLDEAGVEARVVYGTLLGLVRDSELIPWDNDIDLMIEARDAAQVQAVLDSPAGGAWELRSEGRPWDLAAEDGPGWRRGDRARLWLVARRRPRYLFVPVAVEVMLVYRSRGHAWWASFDALCRVEEELLEGQVELPFRDSTIPAPARHLELLERIYGPSWRIPDSGFDSEHRDGTLVREDVEPT